MGKPQVLTNVLEGVKEELKESGKTALEQVGVAKKKDGGEVSKVAAKEASGPDNDENKKLVESIYQGAPMTDEQKKQQELSDKQQEAALRQKLHSEYYQRLINPPKAAEERPAEKVEREKNEEDWELEKKEAKKPKLSPAQAQFRGTGELIKTPNG